MSLTKFQCTTGSADLCMFGSTCVTQGNGTDQVQYCDCAPGFEWDNNMFFQPNCSLPVNANLGILITATLIAFPFGACICYGIYDRRANRSLLRDCAIAAVGVLSTTWFTLLATYLDKGLYVAASIFFGLMVLCCGWWIQALARLMLRGVVGVKNREAVARSDAEVTAVIWLFYLAGFFDLVVFAATSGNVDARNIAVVTLYSVRGVAIGLFSVQLVRYANALIVTLTGARKTHADLPGMAAAETDAIFQQTLKRLRRFRFVFFCLAGAMFQVTVGPPVVFLTLRSLPFAWLIHGCAYLGLLVGVGASTMSLLFGASTPETSGAGHASSHVSKKMPSGQAPGSPGSPSSEEAKTPGASSSAVRSPKAGHHVEMVPASL